MFLFIFTVWTIDESLISHWLTWGRYWLIVCQIILMFWNQTWIIKVLIWSELVHCWPLTSAVTHLSSSSSARSVTHSSSAAPAVSLAGCKPTWPMRTCKAVLYPRRSFFYFGGERKSVCVCVCYSRYEFMAHRDSTVVVFLKYCHSIPAVLL